jgi:aspartate racemase
MADFSTIGILGGMGPEATNRLCALITALTPATKDQEHLPVITYNNPRIPDRVRAVYGEGESPLPEMIRTARILERAGAEVLLMPCNLAHLYLDELRQALRIPLLDMIEEAVKFTIENHPHCHSAGLIASTPTIECGLYEKAFRQRGWLLVTPERAEQEAKVMRAIYGEDGIKCGFKRGPRALLEGVARGLLNRGAQIILAGCTEVSLVLKQEASPFPVIDPLRVIAGVAVRRAMRGERGSATGVKGFHLRPEQAAQHRRVRGR